MSVPEAIGIFLCSLTLIVIASIILSRRLAQVGMWLRLSASLLGLIAAFGADAPEIASSLSALQAGEHDLGLGIVIGSNLFNLATLLGLSALVAGSLRIHRRTLLLDGAIALCILALTVTELLGGLPGSWALILIAAIMIPYVTALAIPEGSVLRIARWLRLSKAVKQTKLDSELDAGRDETVPRPSYADLLDVLPALVSIVLASFGMVHAAADLGKVWGVPGYVTGILVLSSLTGIPNVVTAVQLANEGRGSAVFSETLNSNTFNLIAGAAIPAFIFGTGTLASSISLSLWLLAAATLLVIAFALYHEGIGRKTGMVLILAYLGFAIALVVCH
jgi:cation:H+ antiporter